MFRDSNPCARISEPGDEGCFALSMTQLYEYGKRRLNLMLHAPSLKYGYALFDRCLIVTFGKEVYFRNHTSFEQHNRS